MPQITLHRGCFEIQMQISKEAPTDVYRLADQLVELARALVGKVVEVHHQSKSFVGKAFLTMILY